VIALLWADLCARWW